MPLRPSPPPSHVPWLLGRVSNRVACAKRCRIAAHTLDPCIDSSAWRCPRYRGCSMHLWERLRGGAREHC
eukprot:7220809-Prymnesium_polylepis.1